MSKLLDEFEKVCEILITCDCTQNIWKSLKEHQKIKSKYVKLRRQLQQKLGEE